MAIKFGTDGWRAVIAEEFTFSNVARVTQACATFWGRHPIARAERLVIVGYDRRFLSDQFAMQAAEVLLHKGFRVILSHEPIPTPAVAFAVRARRAVGGIMITASHNPAIFNGFKIKASYGGSADATICDGVEKELQAASAPEIAHALVLESGRISRQDLRKVHYTAIKRFVDFKVIAKSRLRFAHDALFGVGAGCFDELLSGTTCQVTTLNAAHDPFFGGINPEPIEENYATSSAFLRRNPHDICLVTDGDADRIGAMDGRGRALSTHQLICLVLDHLVNNRQGRGRVVKALTTTSMLDKMCQAFGLELIETGVGFKHIAAEMLKGNVLLGAEESGGIAFGEHLPERDGILAGLVLLELLALERVSVNRLVANLEKEFGPHYYARIDARFPLEKRSEFLEECKHTPPVRLLHSPMVDIKTFDGVKYIARDGSWLMLRASGTEPILRIYAETPSKGGANKLVNRGAALARAWLKGHSS